MSVSAKVGALVGFAMVVGSVVALVLLLGEQPTRRLVVARLTYGIGGIFGVAIMVAAFQSAKNPRKR